jgi:lipoprotein-releasing system permease protein
VPLEILIAWKYLGAQRKSVFVFLITLFSALGVCIGTFALVVALSAANGFEEEVTSKMIGKDAHFELIQYGNEPMSNPDSVEALVMTNPEVIAVSPYIVYKIGISSKKVNDGIVIYGIDAERASKVLKLETAVKWGSYSLDSARDTTGALLPTIMLGVDLADRLRVMVGDKVILQTFQSPDAVAMGAATPRMIQCVVSGLFQMGMYEYDANLGYISIPVAQSLLGMPGKVTGLQGIVKDPWKSEQVVDSLSALMRYPYYVSDWKRKNVNLLKWINIEKIIITFVLALIILVAAFNIISSLIMAVLNKTREIGILRSMGVSSAGVMRIFIYMGSFIGLAGSTLGVGSGVLLSLAQLKWQLIKLPPDVYSIPYFPIQIMWMDVLIVFIMANVLCVAATILPAWKASRLDPVGAIRNE